MIRKTMPKYKKRRCNTEILVSKMLYHSEEVTKIWKEEAQHSYTSDLTVVLFGRRCKNITRAGVSQTYDRINCCINRKRIQIYEKRRRNTSIRVSKCCITLKRMQKYNKSRCNTAIWVSKLLYHSEEDTKI